MQKTHQFRGYVLFLVKSGAFINIYQIDRAIFNEPCNIATLESELEVRCSRLQKLCWVYDEEKLVLICV